MKAKEAERHNNWIASVELEKDAINTTQSHREILAKRLLKGENLTQEDLNFHFERIQEEKDAEKLVEFFAAK